MFRAVYPTATKFKSLVQTIVKIAEEIPFIATENGLSVKTLSPDKTTMIVLNIPSIAFDEYYCEGEETFILGSDELNKISKRGTRNDVVELELEREQRRLRLSFKNKKTGVERTFYLSLREGVVEKLQEPSLELPVSIRMLADDYKRVIRDAKLVGEELEFETEGNTKLIIRSVTPNKEYHAILEINNPLISMVSREEKVKARYSIELIEATLKATSAAESLTIEFGNNLPLKLTFDLPGGSTLVYWVAPRVG